MLRPHSTPLAMVFVSMFVILFAPRIATAADPARGAALYESRCGSCHSESVHGRSKRVATDFGDVRRWVSRWNDNLALRWGDEEIDDVSVYLNNTYYKYPCPPSVCKVVSLAPRSHPDS
jgi:mono/diheme cytochrome c family protein